MIPDITQYIKLVNVIDVGAFRTKGIAFIDQKRGIAATVVEEIDEVADHGLAGGIGKIITKRFTQKAQQILDATRTSGRNIEGILVRMFKFQQQPCFACAGMLWY